MSLDWFKADWNRTILFAPWGEGRGHLLPGGWGEEEPDPGVWSVSSMARMAFRLPRPRNQTFLAVELLPFIPCPGIASQLVEVQLNGRRLGELLMQEPKQQVAVFAVEQSLLAASPFAVLSFVMPRARSPQSLGLGSDSRSLGIRLFGVRWVDVWYECQFGARAVTTASKGAGHHFLYGWSEPEPEFTWSERPTAMLVLRPPERVGDMVFQAKVKPFVPRLDLPAQRVKLSVNDRTVGEFAFRHPDPRVIEARIPGNSVGRDRLLLVRFDVESPKRPVDFGIGHDTRELGLALSEFRIELQEFVHRGTGLTERYASAASTNGEMRQPPRISLGKENFSKSALVYGWDAPSEDGAAMLRSPAILAADLTGCPRPLDMIFHFSVRDAQPGGEVDVRVEANGLPAGAFILEGSNPLPQSLRLWPMTMRQSGLTYISFEWSAAGDGASVPVLGFVEFAPPGGEPPPFELAAGAASFRFRPGSPGELLLMDGWHGVTEEGALCLGQPCGLVVPVLSRKLPMNLDLEVLPAGSRERPPDAQVVVEINGRAANCFTPDAPRKVRLDVSPVDLLKGPPWTVRFRTLYSQPFRGSPRRLASHPGRGVGGPGIPFLLKGLAVSAPLDAGRSV